MYDFFASQRNYAEHLLPVWFALPDELRGSFYGPAAITHLLASEGIHPPQSAPPLDSRPIVVAGWKDSMRCVGRPIALLEHGAGQTYLGEIDDPSYAGGRDRGHIGLFLCPSRRVADLNIDRYPDATAAVVGCPKLDRWASSQSLGEPEIPTVAISFHWNCSLLPETRWAFPAFKDKVLELASRPDLKVIGHGHPRAWGHLRKFYEANGIDAVENFDDVVARADCFVVDNSSALYEAAFADIPVLALDAPWYRRDVEHGLRFWSDIPGLHISEDEDLVGAVAFTLQDSWTMRQHRREIVKSVYEIGQDAAISAAAALIEDLDDELEVAPRRRNGGHPYGPAARKLPPVLPERRLRRLGANGAVLHEARLRWVEFSSDERREEQVRLASLTDRELSAGIAETMVDEVVGVG